MRTFVIPDIHERTEWCDKIFEQMGESDQAVLLGDYFHQFNQDKTKHVCQWLKGVFEHLNVTCLLGNHDLSHLGMSYGIRSYLCSGWEPSKQTQFEEEFPDPDVVFERTKLATTVKTEGGDILLSHAGLTEPLYKKYGLDLLSIERYANEVAHYSLKLGKSHPWLLAGRDRGGSEDVGGITWCDWGRFKPIPGVRQMVGHTRVWKPDWIEEDLCIDTNQYNYAVIHSEGLVEIRP